VDGRRWDGKIIGRTSKVKSQTSKVEVESRTGGRRGGAWKAGDGKLKRHGMLDLAVSTWIIEHVFLFVKEIWLGGKTQAGLSFV
jgi:hypothetical protein